MMEFYPSLEYVSSRLVSSSGVMGAGTYQDSSVS